jgi:hypothetical protein
MEKLKLDFKFMLDEESIDKIFIYRLKEDTLSLKNLDAEEDIEFYEAFKKILKYYGCIGFLETL